MKLTTNNTITIPKAIRDLLEIDTYDRMSLKRTMNPKRVILEKRSNGLLKVRNGGRLPIPKSLIGRRWLKREVFYVASMEDGRIILEEANKK
ncbi:hypothetical protein [Halobacillus litoralis]|uniref:hypothetical protein n=1 Tax=Halobacillus litoralis TaxID=45668 RepID=UPI001CD229E1|nr:hypothetical protein [Halobacillus litoralis]MCA1021564.1 hypothetical protein [Halobacillus litoralis]